MTTCCRNCYLLVVGHLEAYAVYLSRKCRSQATGTGELYFVHTRRQDELNQLTPQKQCDSGRGEVQSRVAKTPSGGGLIRIFMMCGNMVQQALGPLALCAELL